jgi:hypothetical protein
MDPFMLLPLRVMETHAEESVRNLVNKRLPYFRRQLESTLEKAPVEQAQKIRRDLQRMEAELGTQNRGGEFGQELERGRRTRHSLSESRDRGADKGHGLSSDCRRCCGCICGSIPEASEP